MCSAEPAVELRREPYDGRGIRNGGSRDATWFGTYHIRMMNAIILCSTHAFVMYISAISFHAETGTSRAD
jgi:hypothetical protein